MQIATFLPALTLASAVGILTPAQIDVLPQRPEIIIPPDDSEPVDCSVAYQVWSPDGFDVPFRRGNTRGGLTHIETKHPLADDYAEIMTAISEGYCVVEQRTRRRCTFRGFTAVYDTAESGKCPDGRPFGLITAYWN